MLAFLTGWSPSMDGVVTRPAIAPAAAELIARSWGMNVNSLVPLKSYKKLRPTSKSITISAPAVGTSTGYSTRAYSGSSFDPDQFCQFTAALLPLFQTIEDWLVSIVMRIA